MMSASTSADAETKTSPRSSTCYEDDKLDDIRCISKIGSGAYSTVYRAVDVDGSHVAVKLITEPRYHDLAVHEYDITKDLVHPNIIKALGCFQTQNDAVMLIQELAEGGELYDRIIPGERMPEEHARALFLQVLDAVQHLHDSDIVHRDLKPENVVVTVDGVAKLCDFGMAAYHGESPKHGCGTIPYMSPEISSLVTSVGFKAHKSHDVWSLGVMLFAMLTCQLPWNEASHDDEHFRAFNNGLHYDTDAWQELSLPMVELFERIFAPIHCRCSLDVIRDYVSTEPLYNTLTAPKPNQSLETLSTLCSEDDITVPYGFATVSL